MPENLRGHDRFPILLAESFNLQIIAGFSLIYRASSQHVQVFIDCADRFAGQGKQENHVEMEKSGLDNLERSLENGQ